jgi:hypothetical protein
VRRITEARLFSFSSSGIQAVSLRCPWYVMDVRVLICWHPGDVFQASVIALEAGKSWNKIYPSKSECLADLCQIGLLTIWDQDDMLESDFDKRDRVLIVRSTVEAEVLAHADFVETTPAKVN